VNFGLFVVNGGFCVDPRYFLATEKNEEAAKVSEELGEKFETLTEIQLHHYYYYQGIFAYSEGHTKNALDLYLKAKEIMDYGLVPNIDLLYRIAFCYNKLGYTVQSTTLLEEIRTLRSKSQGTGNVPEVIFYGLLGNTYTNLGQFQLAKSFLDKTYELALNDYNNTKDKDSKTYLGTALVNYGYFFRMAKNNVEAIEYLDKAFLYLEKGSSGYLEALYQKVRIYIEQNSPRLGIDLLGEGLRLSKNNEEYRVLFNALRYLMELDANADLLYKMIIDDTILVEKNPYAVLDFCTLLIDVFNKRTEKGRGGKIDAGEMAKIACQIRERIHEGGVI